MIDNRYRFYIESDKGVITCSHGKQLEADELVGTCKMCNQFTCDECNVELPGSSIIGYYCKSCITKIAFKAIFFLIILFLTINIIPR